jgi:hypothetical protein
MKTTKRLRVVEIPAQIRNITSRIQVRGWVIVVIFEKLLYLIWTERPLLYTM